MRALVYPAADGWRWNVKGGNNEILASGEAYVRRADAEDVLRQLFGTTAAVNVTVEDHGGRKVANYTLRSKST